MEIPLRYVRKLIVCGALIIPNVDAQCIILIMGNLIFLLYVDYIIGRHWLLALRKVIGNYTSNAQHDPTLLFQQRKRHLCRIEIYKNFPLHRANVASGKGQQ